jgi:hypothetical protein
MRDAFRLFHNLLLFNGISLSLNVNLSSFLQNIYIQYKIPKNSIFQTKHFQLQKLLAIWQTDKPNPHLHCVRVSDFSLVNIQNQQTKSN